MKTANTKKDPGKHNPEGPLPEESYSMHLSGISDAAPSSTKENGSVYWPTLSWWIDERGSAPFLIVPGQKKKKGVNKLLVNSKFYQR